MHARRDMISISRIGFNNLFEYSVFPVSQLETDSAYFEKIKHRHTMMMGSIFNTHVSLHHNTKLLGIPHVYFGQIFEFGIH